MPMPGRNWGVPSYRYGYQGSEMDNEVKGEGNHYTTEFRQLDPRLGRWFSVDPLAAQFPWQSPYMSMDCDPVNLNDVKGDCTDGNCPEDAEENDIVEHDNGTVSIYSDGEWNTHPAEVVRRYIDAYLDGNTEDTFQDWYQSEYPTEFSLWDPGTWMDPGENIDDVLMGDGDPFEDYLKGDASPLFASVIVDDTGEGGSSGDSQKVGDNTIMVVEIPSSVLIAFGAFMATDAYMNGGSKTVTAKTKGGEYDFTITGPTGNKYVGGGPKSSGGVRVIKGNPKVTAMKSCFIAGTKVLGDEIYLNIEDIKLGDYVLSMNDTTLSLGLKLVVNVFKAEVNELFIIKGEGFEIFTTREHPFYVNGTWTEVKNILINDTLVNHRGEIHVVNSIEVRDTLVSVYNIEVADYHTYFVTENDIFVHNKADIKGKRNNPSTNNSLKNTLPSHKKMTFAKDSDGSIHVISGHTKGGVRVSSNSNKDLFPEYMSEKQILNDVKFAYRNVNKKLQTQGDRVKLTGPSQYGMYTIEMWINTKTNMIETAYPIY